MEYFEWYTTAIAKLLWKTPGSSSAVVIPTSNLFPPGAGATTPTPPPPPPSDTTRPTTSITAPAGGSTASGTVNVSANASDNVGVTKVEFLVDGAVKATDTTSSYGFAWDTKTVANGSHTLSAKAYDAAGNVGTSANVSVNVSNQTATAPPPAAPPPPPAAAVPVCQYFSKSLIAHYYHPSCADYSAYGFVNYGTAFYAYTSQVSGTVPVCNYYSTTDQGYAYTRGCADSYGTYKKIGTPFYAYQSAAAGRVGICGYYSSTNKDYAFTRGCAASYGTYNKIGDAPWWYGL
ncbi:hypothetical protein KY386_02315 [Candidatus Parcubacteria bacterium]|nr:hypothetical protein [Candidatus Parcubacteria bacterium]